MKVSLLVAHCIRRRLAMRSPELSNAHLLQRDAEIPAVTIGRHPSTGAIDTSEFGSRIQEKLMALAARAAHAYPDLRSHPAADAPDAPVRGSHTIAVPELAVHLGPNLGLGTADCALPHGDRDHPACPVAPPCEDSSGLGDCLR